MRMRERQYDFSEMIVGEAGCSHAGGAGSFYSVAGVFVESQRDSIKIGRPPLFFSPPKHNVASQMLSKPVFAS